MKLFSLLLTLFFTTTILAQQKTPRCFRLPAQLHEVSGLAIESPDRLWWHNDSGSAPMLYCTNAQGDLTDSIPLPQIKNQDWEDLTTDDKGHFYIGDFGNNGNARKNLKIYIYHPVAKTIDSIEFSYPDQNAFPPKEQTDWKFDMEAFFWHEGKLHLFSKDHYRYGRAICKHYVLPATPGQQVLILKSSIKLSDKVVTAAAISEDGKTVALLAYRFQKFLGVFPWASARVFYFRDFEGDDFLHGKRYSKKVPYFLMGAQYEALDFLNNQTLYLATEKVWKIKQKAKRMRLRG